jgi:hypothetical protein
MDSNSGILLLRLGRHTYRILLNLQEQTQVPRGRCLVNATLVHIDLSDYATLELNDRFSQTANNFC